MSNLKSFIPGNRYLCHKTMYMEDEHEHTVAFIEGKAYTASSMTTIESEIDKNHGITFEKGGWGKYFSDGRDLDINV